MLTAKPILWVKNKRFQVTFLLSNRFERSSWPEKGKLKEDVIRKTLRKNHRAKRYKGFPGRTDARVQACLQTQTSRGMETDMDDSALRWWRPWGQRRKQRTKNIDQLALVLGLLDEEVIIMSQGHRKTYM